MNLIIWFVQSYFFEFKIFLMRTNLWTRVGGSVSELKKSDRSSKIWLFDLIWLVIDFHIEYDQWSFASIVAFSIAFNLSHIEKSMI